MSDTTETRLGPRRSRTVCQAVDRAVALMAPTLVANINPPQTARAAGSGLLGRYTHRVGEWLNIAAASA